MPWSEVSTTIRCTVMTCTAEYENPVYQIAVQPISMSQPSDRLGAVGFADAARRVSKVECCS